MWKNIGENRRKDQCWSYLDWSFQFLLNIKILIYIKQDYWAPMLEVYKLSWGSLLFNDRCGEIGGMTLFSNFNILGYFWRENGRGQHAGLKTQLKSWTTETLNWPTSQ